MPNATIDLPTIPKPAAAEPTPEPVADDLAGRTPMSAIFARAGAPDESQMPNPTPTTPVAPAPVPEPVTPAPVPEPVPEPVTAPTGFQLPPELQPDAEPVTPTKTLTVADLIPEEGPEWAKTEKQKKDIKNWRETWSKVEQENRELKEKAKIKPSPDADLLAQNELLKQRLQEMSGVVERASLQDHPAFQAQFVKPKLAAIGQAKQILTELNLEPATFDRAMSLSGQAQREAFDELSETITSPSARMEFIDLMVKIKDLDRKQTEAMADVKGQHERLQNEDRAARHRAAQEQAKQMGTLVESVVSELADKHSVELFRKIEGNDEWNKGVDQRVASLRQLAVESTDYTQMVGTMAMGLAMPHYRALYMNERKARLASDRELADMKGATPGIGGNGSGAGAGAAAVEEKTGMAKIFDVARQQETFHVA